MWNTMMGFPVMRASMTGPGLATKRGPRGPSMVKATSWPSASRQPAQAAAAGASLRGEEAEAFDDAARSLPVEVGRVQHDHLTPAPPPDGRKDGAVPEGCNHRPLLAVRAPVVLVAEHLEPQRRPDRAHQSGSQPAEQRNLQAPQGRERRVAHIVVGMDAGG